MSRSDAYITVDCDHCSDSTEISLTALAQSGNWDERDVNKELGVAGWVVRDSKDFCCEECWEDYRENP